MLFQNLRAGPALWPVEFDDDRVSLLDAHLIDTVFVAVQRKQTEVTAQANGLNAVNHAVRCQPFKGMGHGSPREESAYITPRRKVPECALGTTRPLNAHQPPRTHALPRVPLRRWL